ncbi:MAG: hypothetical protein AB1Z98_19390 [Nannocystaceae bacterium]
MSKLRNAFIATGIVAWVGGLGTALVVSSCDTEVCEIDPTDPACSPEPIDRVQLPPDQCDYVAYPSVHVVPVRKYDDYYLPVEVDMVWFEHEGETHEARCIWGDDGCTNAWIAGYELEGPINLSTEYCDTVVSKAVKIDRTEDGCHVQTQYMMLEVSTRGCLSDSLPDLHPPTPPSGPWALTTRSAG